MSAAKGAASDPGHALRQSRLHQHGGVPAWSRSLMGSAKCLPGQGIFKTRGRTTIRAQPHARWLAKALEVVGH
jgi:hypothetical protein